MEQKKEPRIHEALAISSTVLLITNRLGSVKHSPHLFNLIILYLKLYNPSTEKSLTFNRIYNILDKIRYIEKKK